MKGTLVLILLLSACATEPVPPPPPPPPPAVVQPPAPPPPVASVARQFSNVAKKEIARVISPSATPDSVQAIHDADVSARMAVATLEKHPTPQALATARTAVRRLEDVLDNSP